MAEPRVTCRRCHGDGGHPLPTVYQRTLELLTVEWQTTSDLLKLLPRVAQTALCNRLAWLKREGFAESRQTEHNGRLHEWRRRFR